jgi:hypothetical protein
MPVEPVELLTLIGGLLILTIPGYLWSYFFSQTLTSLERLVFGFFTGLLYLSIASYALSFLFPITAILIWLLYLAFLLPILLLALYKLATHRTHLPTLKLTIPQNKTTLLLLALLCFSFLMALLPHLHNNYYLPFHVDEWIHWSYTRAILEQATPSFINPYTGTGTITTPQIGFHLITASLHWLTGTNLLTLFVFLPAFLGILLSITAFLIGNRSPRPFGLEAAFLVAFIPTTVRYLGPSFYVPSTLGLLLLVFLLWLIQQKTILSIILYPFLIFGIFLVHPVLALAAIGILFVHTLFLILEKQYRHALLTAGLTVLPMLLVVLFTSIFTSRWNWIIETFLQSASGQQYPFDFNLPSILVSFTDLGLLTWGVLLIGVYISFIKGTSLLKTLSISTIAFIIVIGLYDKLGYGFPSIYERLFLALFLLVTLLAGFGLAELRRSLVDLKQRDHLRTITQKIRHIDLLIPLTLGIIILLIALPTHLSTPYYQMITEQDYQTFTWISENIDTYRDANHSYSRAAVDPFKASPFSAVTGLFIISSSMNPVYRYDLVPPMETFLREKCVNTSFLGTYKLSVIYGDADNANLTKIYEKVYLYPGVLTR